MGLSALVFTAKLKHYSAKHRPVKNLLIVGEPKGAEGYMQGELGSALMLQIL